MDMAAETVVSPLTSMLTAGVAAESKYKDERNAFSTPDEDGKDFISSMPDEMLEHIFSYCVLDHDAERAVKMAATGSDFQENPHILLSLAAMSRRFYFRVEDFSRRFLSEHKQVLNWRTTAEMQGGMSLRRSSRVAGQQIQYGLRIYRMELVRKVQSTCIECNGASSNRATMANGVACCRGCEENAFPDQISLTDALRAYDLRDWMLIPTRKPGPRAKKIDLPKIEYGTIRRMNPFLSGRMVTSFRFYHYDVELIAELVHGDVQAHMLAKRAQRVERKIQKRRAEFRRLRIEFHDQALRGENSEDMRAYHQPRLDALRDPNWDGDYDEDERDIVWGDFSHDLRCIDVDCDVCYSDKMRKYCPWW